jgi:phosphatidylserine/phosphatidylglycerophosphate/cardiolipin synthase-like enzyme
VQKPRLGLAFAAFVTVFGLGGLGGLGAGAGLVGCNTADLKQPGSSGNASGGTGEIPGEEGETPIPDGGRDPVADLDGGVIPKSTNVSIQVQPSDFGAQIEAAIRAATTSVHMTMYLLTDTSIIDALGDLKDAGKDVKVVLNKTFPPNGGDNSSAFAKLQQRGVSVVYAPAAYTFTHAKTVIIDGAKALIMTMNLTQTSAKENREYIATDSDPGDVADCEKLFAADFAGNSVNVNGKLVVSPQNATPVDPRQRIKALIDSARTTLDVEVQSLSDDGLTDAIILAHKDKVAVRVVLSGSNENTPAQQESLDKMKAAGVPVKTVVTPYIHAKTVVVDGTTVFVGSQNFTSTALFQNREIGVVTDAPTEAAKVRDVIAKDFAAGATP